MSAVVRSVSVLTWAVLLTGAEGADGGGVVYEMISADVTGGVDGVFVASRLAGKPYCKYLNEFTK